MREAAVTRVFFVALLIVAVVVAIGAYVLIQTSFPVNNPKVSPSPSVTPTMSPSIAPTPTPTPALSPTPIPTPSPNSNLSIRIVNSTNWAGYVVVSNLQKPQPIVTSVSASWIVPAVEPSASDTFSAVWIGIGGSQLALDQTLIQCGTEQDSIGGQLQYSCWYELLPQFSRTIMPIFVSPGDLITSSIQLSSAANSEWNITIFDLTSGESFSNLFTYASSMLSAEWIIERPDVNNALTPLANFGTVTFTVCSTTVGGINTGIGSFPTSQVVMYSTDTVGFAPVELASVSGLNGIGSQFSVTYG